MKPKLKEVLVVEGRYDKNSLLQAVDAVILETGGEEPTDRDYTEAAMLAAFYSEKRGSRNVEVDYTRVRYLRKPGGSAPGFVTYETYYSAVVDSVNPFESEEKN